MWRLTVRNTFDWDKKAEYQTVIVVEYDYRYWFAAVLHGLFAMTLDRTGGSLVTFWLKKEVV